MSRAPEGPFLTLDRDLAELLFGRRTGRPTISRRVGEVIGRIIGVDAATGTALFHAGLAIAGAVVAVRLVR